MTPSIPPQGQIPPRRDSRMGAVAQPANQLQPAQSPIVGGSAMPPPGMGSSLALPGGGAASVPAPPATGMDYAAPPDSGPVGMPIQGGGGAAMPLGGAPSRMAARARPSFMPPPGAPMGTGQAAPPVGGGAVNPGNGVVGAPTSSVQLVGTPQPAATGYPGARPQPPSPQGAQMTHPQPNKPMNAMSSPMSTGAPPPPPSDQPQIPGMMPAPGMARTDKQQADFNSQQRGGNDLQTAGRPNLNKRAQ